MPPGKEQKKKMLNIHVYKDTSLLCEVLDQCASLTIIDNLSIPVDCD